MAKLYIITGPAGVGKTTISDMIAKKIDKCAVVEGDEIYHMVRNPYVSPWKENNHLEIFWKNVYSIIHNFLDHIHITDSSLFLIDIRAFVILRP